MLRHSKTSTIKTSQPEYKGTTLSDFTGSEIVVISEYIEKNRIGHRQKKGAPEPPFSNRKSRDIVQEITGASYSHVTRMKEIVNAEKENPEKYEN